MFDQARTVSVFCRLKPLDDENVEPCIKYENKYTICTIPPVGCKRTDKKICTFSKVFNECSSQSEIFEEVAYPLVNDLLNRKNGLLFAYGVTGSGKTYTMEGTDENPGIVGRTLKSLFSRLSCGQRYRIRPDNCNGFQVFQENHRLPSAYPDLRDYSRKSGNSECKAYMNKIDEDPTAKIQIDNCTVFISMVEISGNGINDLLVSKNDKNRPRVTIAEDKKNNKYLRNVKEEEVQNAEDALYWYLKGQRRRQKASTNLNDQSSRSHCVFNIRVVRFNKVRGNEYNNSSDAHLSVSQLCLVDLAGSERAKRTGTHGVQLKVAGDINNSLMILQAIMKGLREKHKPGNVNTYSYRDSDLTHLFKTYFENGSNIRMVVCAQQGPEEYDETLNVLNFAEETKEMKISNPEMHLYTPKPTRLPLKPFNIKESSDSGDDEKFADEMKMLLANAEQYRMIGKNELNSEQEMMKSIWEIFDIMNKAVQSKDKLNEMRSLCEVEDNSEELAKLTTQLNTERLDNKRLKRLMKEQEIKSAVTIKNLEDNLKEKDETIKRLKLQKLDQILKKPKRDSLRANPSKTVKVLAQKFEDVSSLSKPIVTTKTPQRVPVNLNIPRKGFFNVHYRRSKSSEQYFEHKEKNEIPSGTMNKLNLKNRRSSGKLKLENLKKADKYVLQHQSVMEDTFQVDYHSGNIIPTAGGGIAVHLDTLETITQGSPYENKCSRKRQSSVNSEVSESCKRNREDNY